MSLNDLRQTLNIELARFLWRQWSQLGVAGDVEFRDSWIIDPEALIVFTMKMGRHDPRLFDEMIDWTVRNGRWISLQRLKNIAASADDETRRALAAFADVVDSHDTRHRWRSTAQISERAETSPAPFFIEVSGQPLPVIGEPDEHFGKRGLDRSKIGLRGLSIPVPMSPPTNLLFKLRSLFGLAPRAEVVAYLLTHTGGRASAIARSTIYSHPAVSEALAELAQSGLAFAQERGFYSTDAERWQRFLEVQSPTPAWVEWPRVFAALSALTAFLAEAAETPISDYLVSSRAVSINDSLRDLLSSSGMPNPFLRQVRLDDAVEALAKSTEDLISAMNAGGSEGETHYALPGSEEVRD
jgi:hypothetical protein